MAISVGTTPGLESAFGSTRRGVAMGSRRGSISGRASWNWGVGNDNVFARDSESRRVESEIDDEEALRWAAVERLPTFDRMRTTILDNMKGSKIYREQVDLRTVDQDKLREEIITKLFHESSPDDDNLKFLNKFRERIDKVGITMPSVEVRYENLTLEASVFLGGRALPTLFNSAVNAVEGIISKFGISTTKKASISILRGVSGAIKPGRLTLLLGPPGSGKTSLLLALAGKLDKTLKISGKITYNGHELHEFVPQKTSAYVSQHDLHTGEMTVRETLEFSAKCQGVGSRTDLIAELFKREKEAGIRPEEETDYFLKASTIKEVSSGLFTDYILKILGLDICADTVVGDDMRRGISGGQKKRVTTGEIIVGPVTTLFMDEISTGLDSSTTFQIIKCLGDITRVMDTTTVISLLQPAPETYNLFDDILLLSDGQLVYHGPREHILEFFESCGFKCPARKGVADFLQEVTSRKDQEQYWARDSPYRYVAVKSFADAFRSFHVGAAMHDDLSVPFDRSKSHKAALSHEKYSASTMEMVKINFEREILLMKRNAFIYIFKTCQISVMATIALTLFLRTQRSRTLQDAQIFSGALFFGVLNIMFNGYSELSMTIVRLPVYYKQRDMLFFPGWAFTLATFMLRIPSSIMEASIWVILTYYSIGFAPAATRFFRQLFLLFWVHQMSSSMFRLMSGLCRSMIIANTGGSAALLVVFVLGGFLLPRKRIHPWWIWGYWISPLAYAQNAIDVNEFLAPQWNKPVPNSRHNVGVTFMLNANVFPYKYWYWIGLCANVGFALLFNVLFTFSLTYLGPLGSAQATLSEEPEEEEGGQLKGDLVPGAFVSKKIMKSTPRSLTNAESLPRQYSTGRKSFAMGSGLSSRVDGSRELSMSAMNGVNRSQKDSSKMSSMELEEVKAPPRKSILPFTPLAITFDDVRYFVDMPAQMKSQGVTDSRLQLLRGITGSFRPQVLTALIGVSGAGKTTLMDVLAGRKTGGYIEGDIKINGYPKVQETFARIAGYCEQNDIHSPQLTIHESLIYSAWLRLPSEVDGPTKMEWVQQVMDLVELTVLKDALVGLPGVTGLSTEQRKRLTIAVELVANPSIIFMDEPTSGLDARAAAIVMRTVRATVDTGRTVVCTIHQPSIDIFEAFDELLLMKRGGQVIYAGPLGKHSSTLIEYFQAVPGVPKITEGYNPATWMLEVTSAAVEQRLGMDFAAHYSNSALFQKGKAVVRELSNPPPDSKDLFFPTPYSQPFISQARSCLWKQKLTYWRSPDYNNVRMLFTVIAALLFGTVFWQLGGKRNTQAEVISIMASMYGAVIFIGVNNASTVQPVVGTERTVFYRERAAGMYAAGSYALSQVLIEIPYCFVQVIVYAVITYSMIGLEWTAAKFFWYMYFMLFTFFYFTFYGMMAVGLTPNVQIGAIVASFFYQFWNLFSGFLVPRKKIPGWWIWYYWICPVAWTLYGLIVTQFGDVETLLEPTDPTQPAQTVKEFLDDYLGFKRSFLPVVAIMVLVFPVLFAVVFMLTIKVLNFQTR